MTLVVATDPGGFLGRDHAEAYGDDPALLVKLLHAGERLPVHCHPDRDFARRHLGCPWGKTEARVIVGVDGPDPVVHLGFREDMDSGRLAELVEAQRVEPLLAILNAVPVATGDTVLVPACPTPSARGCCWPSSRGRPTCRCCWNGRASPSTVAATAISGSASS